MLDELCLLGLVIASSVDMRKPIRMDCDCRTLVGAMTASLICSMLALRVAWAVERGRKGQDIPETFDWRNASQVFVMCFVVS